MAGDAEQRFQEELRKVFIADTRTQLAETEQVLLALEALPDDEALMDRYFRFVHTIKGNAESMEFSSFGAFVHRLEDLISALRKAKIAVTSEHIDLFLAANDFIRTAIAQYEQDPGVVVADSSLSQRIEDAIARLSGVAPAAGTQLPSLDSPPQGSGPLASPSASIRVSAQKVNELINYFGEQVILVAALNHQLATGENSTDVSKTLMHLEKVTAALHRATLALRMFPLKQLFEQMRRVVRETAKLLHKEVRLELSGEAIELDKLVLDELTAPVMHIVRNAIDHGIEVDPQLRANRGKSPSGTILIAGEHHGGFLHLKIRDDGAGINKEKLLAKAIAQGMVSPNEQLSDEQIFNLIFYQGLSTKEVTTETSGRGVGMDVVADTLKKLKGSYTIASQVDLGTTFILKVPLSLAMLDGTVFRLGASTYIIPHADYREVVVLDAKQITKHDRHQASIRVHDTLIPVVPLQDYLRVTVAPRSEPPQRPARDERLPAFIVAHRNRLYAVMVDELLTQSKVVLKHLGPEVHDIFGIGGATILGDGSVVLIIEVGQVLDRYSLAHQGE